MMGQRHYLIATLSYKLLVTLVMSDHAGKNRLQEIKNFFKSEGILNHFSKPESNGRMDPQNQQSI
jgi:hypothetical protein